MTSRATIPTETLIESLTRTLDRSLTALELENITRSLSDAEDFGHCPNEAAQFMAERLPTPFGDNLHISDLYFASALLQNTPAALEAFDARYRKRIAGCLTKMGLSPNDVDEAYQKTLIKLFTPGVRSGKPAIENYSAIAPLLTWVRVIAVRIAINHNKRALRDTEIVTAVSCDDPSLALLHNRYNGLIKEAIQGAMRELPTRQRNLLRFHLIDGLTIDQVGAMYGVHKTTAFRWLVRARETIWRKVERTLAKERDLSKRDLQSMVDFLGSALDVSLERILVDVQSQSSLSAARA